ncbi:MAG TPA: glutamate-cysteine ligase family protein [Pyrinomonadaceae bacterium]|nr:glutamate-cysteine ligase family protein [Pyrinomonadaceae bacterium]
MGQHEVYQVTDERKLKAYMKALLGDLRALEVMLETGKVESGVRRIGAEQEMFLVDRDLNPAPVAQAVLKRTSDKRLTTEIARFNLEANLTPLAWGGDCLSRLQKELEEVIGLARACAQECGADILLTGILPTLRLTDLTLDNLTPIPRYRELNRSVTALRGGAFNIHIKGIDELQITHDNMVMESCNTSFQLHYQVGPDEFVPLYNMAQAITAPVLAAAVNSPLLFGHRLWQETRLALFQHSADTRSNALQMRSHPTRVRFGDEWLRGFVLELFREQIARFRVIMITEPDEDPTTVLARNEIPKLSALRLHNGTVWPWNRACYGVVDGRAHLRIENRVLPSGPTTLDEMANAAFFFGLMAALPKEYGEIERRMAFDDAKSNFFAAARHGLKAQFTWLRGKSYPATSLILDHLLPLAREGLKDSNIEPEDVDAYLGVIEERVRSGQTGAMWARRSLAAMGEQGTRDIRLRTLTAFMLARQHIGEPVHSWPVVLIDEMDEWRSSYQTVGQFMSTDLFTVRPDDLVDLAANVMDWRHVRHVPVEDDKGHLVGLVSHRNLLRLLARGTSDNSAEPISVSSIMKTNPLTVSPQTRTLEAINLMRENHVGCLPVVEAGRLVGIVTAYDFLTASAKLFEKYLTTSVDVTEGDRVLKNSLMREELLTKGASG